MAKIELKVKEEEIIDILIEEMADEMLVHGNPNSDCALALDTISRKLYGDEKMEEIYEKVSLRCAQKEEE